MENELESYLSLNSRLLGRWVLGMSLWSMPWGWRSLIPLRMRWRRTTIRRTSWWGWSLLRLTILWRWSLLRLTLWLWSLLRFITLCRWSLLRFITLILTIRRGSRWWSSMRRILTRVWVVSTCWIWHKERELGDGRLPSRYDLHGFIRLFLPPESAPQLPSSFLLTPSLCSTPVHPHISDIESYFFALETSMCINLGKKEGAGYLRILRECFQGQKKTKGIIIHVSYVASYFLGRWYNLPTVTPKSGQLSALCWTLLLRWSNNKRERKTTWWPTMESLNNFCKFWLVTGT